MGDKNQIITLYHIHDKNVEKSKDWEAK